jgi:hypothetical protein
MKLDSAKREEVSFAAQSEEAAEAHDRRTPAFGIDMRPRTVAREQRFHHV